MAWFGERKSTPEDRVLQAFHTQQNATLEDANIACLYAAEAGIALPTDAVEALIAFRRAFAEDSRQIAAEVEGAFWIAAAEIAAAVRPVKMEALRQRYAYRLRANRSDIGWVVRWYRRMIWVVLLVTILVHAFQVSLDGGLERARDAALRFDAARQVMRDVNLAPIPQPSSAASATEPSTDKPGFSQVADKVVTVQDTGGDAILHKIEVTRLLMCAAARDWITEANRLARLVPQGDPWHTRIATALTGALRQEAHGAPMAPDAAPSAQEPLPERDGEYVRNSYHCDQNGKPERVERLSAELVFGRLAGLGSSQAWEIVRAAESLRAQLTNFALPFLYGLLGAMASIVRSVSRDVGDVTFNSTSRVFYTLRLPLGALAGATVGLLFDPQTLASLKGFTSLGVAFGFGYGVEVFFAAIDGLVTRLIRPPSTPTK